MSFRFRKRVRLFKGAWINLSKRGGSLSIGGRGATTNISKRGVRETVGLPGSGISYVTKTAKWRKPGARSSTPKQSVRPVPVVSIIVIAFLVLWVLAHMH